MKSLVTQLKGIAILSIVLFSSCMNIQNSEPVAAEGEPPAIIPAPQSIEWGGTMFRVPKENIICHNAGSETAATWLQELLRVGNRNVNITSGNSCGNWNLTLDSTLEGELGQEGYSLNILNDKVEIKGASEAGLFYAVQTLRQLFPSEMEQGQFNGEDIFLRQVAIQDYPQYSWRGTMVDVARSFFGLDYLKRHVDRMALYKLNRLHLHLTDDQGWRIEIKGKPLLTEIGSKGSVKGGQSGYLTQEEYRELQEYAFARNVIVIPEVDLPGHIYSALIAYPELNCPENANLTPARATPPQLYDGYEVGWSKLCLEKPEVYDFVSEVIGELSAITKGPWIHIGGDEIEDPLYEDFIVKADSIVQTYGKTAIGWEEVTKAEVSDSMISQQWHGKAKSIVDLPVIASICTNFYLDHANVPGQPNTLNWCKEDGVSLENVYSFKTDNPKVIGVEAPVWTEHVLNEAMLDDRFWPRIIAVAEVGWTPANQSNFINFKDRLRAHSSRLQNMGIHFYPTPEIDWGTRNIAENPNSVFLRYNPYTN